MSAGSSNESARDCLTKSSRLVVFCSSSNSFMASTVLRAYLLPALTAVSTIPLISASLDHPLVHLDHCCPLDSLSFHFTAFYLSAYPFVLPLLSPCDSLCVVGQKLLQIEGVFLLGVHRVPPAAGKLDPWVVLRQLGHIPRVCHHLERGKSTTSAAQFFVFQCD